MVVPWKVVLSLLHRRKLCYLLLLFHERYRCHYFMGRSRVVTPLEVFLPLSSVVESSFMVAPWKVALWLTHGR